MGYWGPYAIILGMSETPLPVREPGSAQPGTSDRRMRTYVIIGAVVLALILVASGFAVAAMLRSPERTETIRDIVIVFMAGEALIIGLALVLLIV
jgi:hypothetical protein